MASNLFLRASFQPTRRRAAAGAYLLLLVIATGCGSGRPTTLPVRGTVMLDGQPVAEASVMLFPREGGRPASGVTNERGEFEIFTFDDGDGALVGVHDVAVSKVLQTGIFPDADGLEGSLAPEGIAVTYLVPQVYSDPKTSGLSVDVQRGLQPLRLDLTTPAP